MKKLVYLLITILFVICSACSDPAIGLETVNDPSEYLKVNIYVADYIETELKGSLPLANQVDVTKAEYYYRYECSALGNPNFVIYLNNSYEKAEEYIAEEARLLDIAVQTFLLDSQTLYVMKVSDSVVKFYGDEKIMDGVYFVLEMAIADSTNQTVQYLSALQQDSNQKYDIITRFIDVYKEHKGTVLLC